MKHPDSKQVVVRLIQRWDQEGTAEMIDTVIQGRRQKHRGQPANEDIEKAVDRTLRAIHIDQCFAHELRSGKLAERQREATDDLEKAGYAGPFGKTSHEQA